MSRYKLHYLGMQIIRDDGLLIPVAESNWAYREYLAWLDQGNVPDPADPEPPPDPIWTADQATLAKLVAQRDTLKAGIVTINTHMDSIVAGPAAPSQSQTGTALKLIAQDIKTMLTGLDMLIDDMAILVRRSTG